MDGGAGVDADPGDVATRMRQALHQAQRERVTRQPHNRDYRGLYLELKGARADHVNHIRVIADDFGDQCGGTGGVLQLIKQRPVIAVVAVLLDQRDRLGGAEDG